MEARQVTVPSKKNRPELYLLVLRYQRYCACDVLDVVPLSIAQALGPVAFLTSISPPQSDLFAMTAWTRVWWIFCTSRAVDYSWDIALNAVMPRRRSQRPCQILLLYNRALAHIYLDPKLLPLVAGRRPLL